MGTHIILVAEVVNADIISGAVCMTYDYYHQIKGGKTPKAAATYIEEKKVAETPKGAMPQIATKCDGMKAKCAEAECV